MDFGKLSNIRVERKVPTERDTRAVPKSFLTLPAHPSNLY